MTPVTRMLLALALVAMAATPAADAQQSAVLVLQASPIDHALAAGETNSTIGTTTFSADATVLLNTNGVPVTYTITKAPAWLSVTITPSTDVFQFYPNIGASYTTTKPWRADLLVADNASGDDTSYVEITAVAQPQAPQSRGALAKIEIAVRLHATPSDPCPDAPAAPVPAARAAATPTPEPVHVQSATATISPVSWAAIAGFAAVGAGVGLALKRRK